MSFWSKVANVATGGIYGAGKHLAHGNVKGALLSTATGGVAGGPRVRNARTLGPVVPVAGAQEYLNSFSPEQQSNIRQSWGTNRAGINDWYGAAQAAGAVPKPAVPAPAATPSAVSNANAMSMSPTPEAGRVYANSPLAPATTVVDFLNSPTAPKTPMSSAIPADVKETWRKFMIARQNGGGGL